MSNVVVLTCLVLLLVSLVVAVWSSVVIRHTLSDLVHESGLEESRWDLVTELVVTRFLPSDKLECTQNFLKGSITEEEYELLMGVNTHLLTDELSERISRIVKYSRKESE